MRSRPKTNINQVSDDEKKAAGPLRTKHPSSTCCMVVLLVGVMFLVTMVIFTSTQQHRRGGETETKPSIRVPITGDKNHVILPTDPTNQHQKDVLKSTVKHERNTMEPFRRDETSAVKNITIEAVSSFHFVSVSVGGMRVYMNNKTRGIHLVVINQYNGQVMGTKVFDTYMKGFDNYMVEYLSGLREGMILVFAVKDEASMGLSEVGKRGLKELGSRLIDGLGWRDTWLLLCQKGRKPLKEYIGKRNQQNIDFGDEVKAKAVFDLDRETRQCKWGNSTTAQKRAQFCFKYVAYYGNICNCDSPAPVSFVSPFLVGNRVGKAPITIMASNRPHYLYAMLAKLLSVPGVNKNMVTVYVDGFHDEVIALTDLLDVRIVEHNPLPPSHANTFFEVRLHQQYKFALGDTFKKHPHAEFMMIFEEDLEVSVDIMDYFSQFIPLLLTDESVYCISAWNDNGFKHSTNDPAMAYRSEWFPGLGWILKRNVWNEIEPKWLTIDQAGDWDFLLRDTRLRKDRECIFPDISRTFHMGKIGQHQNSYISNFYNETVKVILNEKLGNKFDAWKFTKDAYETEMQRLIKNGKVVDHAKNPCRDKDFIPDTSGKTYVVYIDFNDRKTWLNLSKCFRLWSYDVRGNHKNMWRFWMKKNHVIVIGSQSPYFVHKPSNVRQLTNLTEPKV